MFSRACSCQCTPACMVPTAAATHSAAPGSSIHVTPSLLGAPRKQYWTLWGICLCALPMLQILKWHKPPLSCRRGQRQRRTKPDAFFISFFFFLLNNAHIISCLKLQSLAAKHISSVCVAWEVSMSPASCCHLHPPLHRKLPPIKWACRNVSLVAYAGVCVMYFCSAAVRLGKILFSPRCYFQELTSRFL